MDLAHAVTEPLAKLISFHDAFNRNVKLTYGALAQLEDRNTAKCSGGKLVLPNGGEPWGKSMPWRDADEAIRQAAVFVSEMGIARAASAFEDYLDGVKAELDRAADRTGAGERAAPAPALTASSNKAKADDAKPAVPSLASLITRLGVDRATIAADLVMVEFFQVARNCVVHRSNRASPHLADLRACREFASALQTWPRRKGKWALNVPEISEGKLVDWRPRHSIMASAAFHRCATALDRAAVGALGRDGIVAMAAHWCLLADVPVPCPAKLNAQTMVRTQLTGRYSVRDTRGGEVVQALRDVGIWNSVLRAFEARGLTKASHAKRRAVRQRKK